MNIFYKFTISNLKQTHRMWRVSWIFVLGSFCFNFPIVFIVISNSADFHLSFCWGAARQPSRCGLFRLTSFTPFASFPSQFHIRSQRHRQTADQTNILDKYIVFICLETKITHFNFKLLLENIFRHFCGIFSSVFN